MIHMVFMKFEPHYFTSAVTDEITRTFKVLHAALPDDIRDVQIKENCVKRDTNMDLLIRMDLADESSLQKYLGHPAHIAIGEKINPHITARSSFDYEE